MSMFSRCSDLQKRWFSSRKIRFEVLGSLLKWNKRYFMLLLAVLALSPGISYLIAPNEWIIFSIFLGINLIAFLTIKTCYQLLDIFNLRRKDSATTWAYMTVMFTMVAWLVGFLLLYDINGSIKITATIGVIGVVLSWIFQDKIQGIATYIHLRLHNLLKIGDWIQVPAEDVDGIVTKVTLSSVIISNWDTTTSVMPINKLSSGHFINLQNMMEGKTYGRRMDKTFILDTGWFHPLSSEEIEILKNSGDVARYLKDDVLQSGESNAKLFRIYLYHWLSNHNHVSPHPRLLVRWQGQTDNGMPLQIHAFITDSTVMAFEWQQSQIIEHIIESLGWFGLRLYQGPSSFDVSNNNVYLTSTPASYRN